MAASDLVECGQARPRAGDAAKRSVPAVVLGWLVDLEPCDHAHGGVQHAVLGGEEAAENVAPRRELRQPEPARPVRTDHTRAAQRPREDDRRPPLAAALQPVDEVVCALALDE